MRRLVSLLVLGLFLRCINADVVFTWPWAGAVLGSGDVTLWWKENGDALLIQEMSSHLLVLFTGSNSVMTMLNEWVVPIGTYNTTIHLNSNIGPNANNSYFFGIQSNPLNTSNYHTTSIPTLINFSPRFSLTNMTGNDFTPSIKAANAACDTTDGPDSVIRDESQDQVSSGLDKVYLLSSAQITTSGVIHNPTDGVVVTTIPLTPTISSTTSSLPTVTTIISTPTPTISPQPITETPTQLPTFTTIAHERIIIVVPVALSVAIMLGIVLFFLLRYRRRHSLSEKSDPDESILSLFPPPPTHPNTWMDTTTSTLKNRSNHFWHRLKAKRPRGSVAELPGYEGPGTLKPASQRNIAPDETMSGNMSKSFHTPMILPPTIATDKSPTNFPPPQRHSGREVIFLAVGPDPTFNKHNSDIKPPSNANATHSYHSYPRISSIDTRAITTENSEVPSSSALSSYFDRQHQRCPSSPSSFRTPIYREKEVQIPPQPNSSALRGSAKVITISRGNSLVDTDSGLGSGSGFGVTHQTSASYPERNNSIQTAGPDGVVFSNSVMTYPVPSYHTRTSSSIYQSPPTYFSQLSNSVSPRVPVSLVQSFRSPMGGVDDSAEVREAERRIRGLLGGGEGVVSLVSAVGLVGLISPVSAMSR
ncbi:hypothetical protein SBOR_9465 [Sclerotinia borealis F-4128]|uniref:Uncharacterized protein n=1 Tax=Sclerotinia borealis (strain F-4128) TaxID=1432307 RepID=W9C2M8_SCLBF|nr:hypothetical protein SBOR_9465 [Sclerotinia borealis F-4128]